MEPHFQNNGPVVIGSLGGSGTRVIAEIISLFGYFIGSDLNKSQDNLWYTLLFKRPGWFYNAMGGDDKEIKSGLSLLEKLLSGHNKLNMDELKFLIKAILNTTFFWVK